MECPKCSYALSAFDMECPRCRNFAANGIVVPNVQGHAQTKEAELYPTTDSSQTASAIATGELWYSKLNLDDKEPVSEAAQPTASKSVEGQYISPVLPTNPAATQVAEPSLGVRYTQPYKPPAIQPRPDETQGSTKPAAFIISGLAACVILGLLVIWIVAKSSVTSSNKNQIFSQHNNPSVEASSRQELQAEADAKAQAAQSLNTEVAGSIAHYKGQSLTDEQAASIRESLRTDCQSSLRDCAESLQKDPTNALALAEQVRALRYLGRAKSADAALSSALALLPNNPLLLAERSVKK